ncbi:hypothetical protein BO71DRAFT_39126 [Aspergillus ellipticus CBS 707.79]|uniref:Uncharacterized protein n=1 Tax=Aspergillus ellipticus CBS 707.79 TaxID=1448320 RepID=A0A319DBU0_9EURO|nr:hypothetical protein BO71DRAFT_39126 [Aspergillus ellipticus CBS 707.79]
MSVPWSGCYSGFGSEQVVWFVGCGLLLLLSLVLMLALAALWGTEHYARWIKALTGLSGLWARAMQLRVYRRILDQWGELVGKVSGFWGDGDWGERYSKFEDGVLYWACYRG